MTTTETPSLEIGRHVTVLDGLYKGQRATVKEVGRNGATVMISNRIGAKVFLSFEALKLEPS